jgi:hypothetical protein
MSLKEYKEIFCDRRKSNHKKRSLVAYEDQEQEAFVQWTEYTKIPGTNIFIREYLFHPPNGGWRNKIEAKRLKRQGVTAGVNDLFIAYPFNGKHGLWIEMKRTIRSVTSHEQKDWLRKMRDVGYQAEIAKGCTQAQKITCAYFGMDARGI